MLDKVKCLNSLSFTSKKEKRIVNLGGGDVTRGVEEGETHRRSDETEVDTFLQLF